jgi:serine phosphatase RsbU (regulator of sigma subunit)
VTLGYTYFSMMVKQCHIFADYSSVLPETLPDLPGYEFGALMIPARAVGGDFYTFFQLPKNRLGIVVGDVSDKGVPAALFMALTYSLIRAEAVRTSSPVQAFRKVNQHLLQMNSSSMFVTMVYGILDCGNGEFRFARAGHHPLISWMEKAGAWKCRSHPLSRSVCLTT